MSAEPTPPTELPWWFFPALALNSAICAVWGYTTVHCGGVVAGILWTFATFGLSIFVIPKVLIAVVLLVLCGGGLGLALARHRWFRPRRELLFLLLPIVWLLLGVAVARAGWLRVTCSLGEWP